MKTSLPLLVALATVLAVTGVNGAPPSTNAAPAPTPATNAAPAHAKPFISITDDDDDDTATNHSASASIVIDSGKKHSDDDSGDWLYSLLIPLAGIVMTFGMPVLIVFFICYFRYQRRQAQLQLAREFLAKGLPVPPQLLDESQAVSISVDRGSPASAAAVDLRKGFKLAFIGLGVTLALYVWSPHGSSWGWGLIPSVMGLGLIISGAVQLRMPDKTPPPGPPSASSQNPPSPR